MVLWVVLIHIIPLVQQAIARLCIITSAFQIGYALWKPLLGVFS